MDNVVESNAATESRRRPAGRVVPRSPRVGFREVPRHWLGGEPAATHVVNAVNLLFPAGERFFVRSVRRYMDRIHDPELLDRVKGFFGQEGRHAQMHERFFEQLRAQGYPVDDILERYERFAYGFIERASPEILSLSVTVALEHFTAILAEDALDGPVLDLADPAMRQLLAWHAMEELEHKDVAFDVLQTVNPSYFVRIAGMALGAACLAGFWIHITKQLAEHDGSSLASVAHRMRRLGKRGHPGTTIGSRVFLRGVREYLRPGFHPRDKDHGALVAKALARLAAEGVIVEPAHGG